MEINALGTPEDHSSEGERSLRHISLAGLAQGFAPVPQLGAAGGPAEAHTAQKG